MKELLRTSSLALMISAMIACAPHIEGGGGSGGGGGTSTGSSGGGTACAPPSPGMCAPSTECVNGVEQTGGATCVDGQWVCTTTPCTVGCAETIQYCANNLVTQLCCPPGDPCASPPPYCDLGNGNCFNGPCYFDAGTGCAGGTILASDYDQTCNTDADCAAVYQGSLCSDCYCVNAAINQTELQAYGDAIAAGAVGLGTGGCGCPSYSLPVCTAGVCTFL